jgi:CheY-like chemotaxis protein
MNEVIERGIEILEEMEVETDIVESEEEIRELRRKSELFDALSSFSGFILVRSQTIDELLEVLLDNASLNEFVKKQRNWVLQDLEIQKTMSKLAQNYSKNFASLVEIIQQISDTFRSFYVLASSEPERKVVIHPNFLHKFPELIAGQIQGILEFLGFKIRYRIINDRILLEWQTDEVESSSEEEDEETPSVKQELKEFEEEVLDVDSRIGMYKDLRAKLEGFTEDSAKSEKEIIKDIINIASILEIPRWEQGLFTTGNRRFTYIPQEFMVDFFDSINISNSEKLGDLLREMGKKLHDLQLPGLSKITENFSFEKAVTNLKTIFNDYFGFGKSELSLKKDGALLTIQNPLLSGNSLLEIINGYLLNSGYKTTIKRSIEEGHYRNEYVINRVATSILIVDDEKRILQSLAKTLEREEELSYSIITAESGEDALMKLEKEGPFDLVLSDHNMPGMKGVELLEKVRLHDPSIIRILITGYSELEIAKDAINKARIHFFIEKPPEAQVLRDIIKQEILKKRSPNQ